MTLQELELEQIQINIELCENNIKRTEHRIKQIQYEAERNIAGHIEAKQRELDKIEKFKEQMKAIQNGEG